MLLKTFKLGGIHPNENKFSASKPIEVLDIPKRVFIPVGQALGAPSIPVVKRGELVKVGQLIAKGESFISANVHSSVSGKVFKIDNVIDSSGYKKKAIIINVEGDQWLEDIDRSDEIRRDINYNKFEIIEKIKAFGVVGLGGATFPSHIKYMIPKGKNIDVLVINGVECEPYLTSDHRLMLEKAEEILIGIKIFMSALEVNRAIIGIENNKKDAIFHISSLLKDSYFDGIEVQALKVQYPQGGEKQLIKALLGREVPSGSLPLEVGCVVNNVGTALAVYEAVQKNKPLIERVVTFTGKGLKETANFMVRIGTPISAMFDKVGGKPVNLGKIINGGPMMGKSIPSEEAPVVKGTSGILLMESEESKRGKTMNCIRCSKCTTVCPMGLEPYLLSNLTKISDFEALEKNLVMDCIECGSCSYTCPAVIPLLDNIRLSKSQVGIRIRARKAK